MNQRSRRRRGVLLLALALAAGGLAASQVSGRMAEVERRVGRPVPVLVAREDIPRGAKLDGHRARAMTAVSPVPERFAAPDSLASPEQVDGRRSSVQIAAGAQITLGMLGGETGSEPGASAPPRVGERAVEIAVAGGDALAGAQRPGTRVDVLVSTEPREGPGRTLLALEGVELLGLRSGGGGAGGEGGSEGAAGRASATATLRVTLRQAVYLTAAQNFAREIRLLPRPQGDRRRAGRHAFSAGGL